MEKIEITKQVLEIFNREKNWYHTTRNGNQLDIDNTMSDIVEWVAKIIDTQTPVIKSVCEHDTSYRTWDDNGLWCYKCKGYIKLK